MKSIFKLITLFICLGFALSSCTKSSSDGGDKPAGDGPVKLKIGVIMPKSGPLTAFGKDCLSGVEQRVKEINAEGKYNITLIVEDNKGDKTATKQAFKKLAEVDQVNAIIGPITSTNCLGIVRDTERSKIVTITPTGTNDTITGKSPYMFRACFNDSFQGQIVANYAINNLKVKSAAVMIDAASDYSKGLAASFKKSFEAGGGKVTVEEKYQQKDTEFNAQLSKIKSSGAEIVFVPGYPPELPLIIKQAGIMGLKARFCGADGWDNDAVIQNSGEKIIGSFIVGAFSREDKRDIVQNFVKNMSAEAGSFSALGYDAVGVVVEASKSGTDRESIKKGMLGIKNYEGVTGTITITENGDATKSAVVLEIYKDGDTYKKKFLTTVNP